MKFEYTLQDYMLAKCKFAAHACELYLYLYNWHTFLIESSAKCHKFMKFMTLLHKIYVVV